MSGRAFLPLLRALHRLRVQVRASSVLLVAGIALAICALGLQTDWGRRWPHQVRREAPPAPAVQPALPQVLPPFVLAAAGAAPADARPLFVPTRRPAPPAPPPPAAAATMQKGQFVLLGTSVGKTLTEFALLKELSTSRTHRIARGKQINGITLERIETARVVLRQGGDSEELTMKARGPSKSAAGPHFAPQTGAFRDVNPSRPAIAPAGAAVPGLSPAASDAVLRFVPPSHAPASATAGPRRSGP